MQEAHQQAQQNKPTSGTITGSGEECWEDLFFPRNLLSMAVPERTPKNPEYLIALASKLLNGFG